MSFSPNTSTEAQAFFSQTSRMPICECHETYLGLPAYSSHNKQELFSNVKEKIWKLLHAWNEKLFSVGGRLLKHRYYSRNSFLEAHLGHSPSLTWQEIHWGRELLIKGLRFKIDNGFQIQSGHDPWIPGNDEFRPISYSGPPSLPDAHQQHRPFSGSNWKPTTEISWMPPAGNLLKMNVDAAANFNDKKFGIGAVVRNNKGEVIAVFSKPSQGCFRSNEMEAKTLFHSLIWATQHQLPIALVETDAQRVSTALNSFHRLILFF
uniref:RNase H type-1 domain-containing protein n=1 Tax=Cannabis sativa TaxID=3483 RepID=A0A803QH29_CANSA